MGIYRRSKFWWLLLERPRQKPIKESCKIPWDADTAERRKELKQEALEV
jgi:hypothetical protein